MQVVISIDANGKVQAGSVSIPIEERYGRDWADERQTDTYDRAMRLVLEAIQVK